MQRSEIIVDRKSPVEDLITQLSKVRREGYEMTGRCSLVDDKVFFETRKMSRFAFK